ncbi:nitrous oxide reductase family maturation protein NosD [Aegicerativicinus sediminis]|uniref:nitrous oxide reductase family maturation protein NosD n=1 Tax=Aegicerativicinus sediminis TaxID=2893202 RepID=UPI001E506430|nr:nitrous oxide reductase family maturation protein NosD [Aegicerativicinus sediminis]
MRLDAILIAMFLLLTSMVYAQPIEVCKSCTINTIKGAIENAKSHDTIIVKREIYKETDIIVDKPLTLIGKDYPVIDGQLQGEIITVNADSVTIEGFVIKNVGVSYTKDFAAIRLRKSEHFIIRNNVLQKLFFGIYIEKCKNGIVAKNQIMGDAKEEFNSGNGVQLWYSNNVQVIGNHIEGVRDGIYLEFSPNCSILKNISRNNVRYGLHFMFSNENRYTGNIFENNGAGVAVMFSKKIKMTENTFRKNWGTAAYGMLLKEINDAEIRGNTFEENTTAINIEGSNRVVYTNNDFKNNGWAIKVRGACYSNTFRANNFLNNSFDLAYNSKVNDNTFIGNYWSTYSGYDLNKDGIGDVPYRPVKLFSYIVNRTPETIILLRSVFIDIIDFSEKVSPVFTPDNLMDAQPKTKRIRW